MRVLLDTHTFIWFVESNPRISAKAVKLIEDKHTEALLSLASIWEMAIKISTGKLQFSQPLDLFVPRQMQLNGIARLAIAPDHAYAVARLPFHHRDPFDRLLAAQSLVENIPLISADPLFDPYGVNRIW